MWSMATHPKLPNFISSFGKLPEILFRKGTMSPVAAPAFVVQNSALASQIGLSEYWLNSNDALQSLAGNMPLQNVEPLAMAYAGHQFGHFTPSLGDGRAVLIGEIIAAGGIHFDLHLKGSGRTAYSRGGDGRATLSAMLREYIISEAMAALGIPTTRALAVIQTGRWVQREKMEQGAVLTRIAKSHVRVGTFQYLAVREEYAAMQELIDHELALNFPGAPQGSEKFIWFLNQVIARQATLIAKWMNVGFIHGVMNTDNMQVAGETIDYGPCAFMDHFNPAKTFSSIDQNGRYAWDKQPVVALWNLTRLAEAMLPLLATNTEDAIKLAEAELLKFMPAFENAFEIGMSKKLGNPTNIGGDFIATTLQILADTEADFTLFFSTLTQVADGASANLLNGFFQNSDQQVEWINLWHEKIGKPYAQLMVTSNPVYIPRNHFVEQALHAANLGDLKPFHRLITAITKPFERRTEFNDLELAPTKDEVVHQTFCGT